MDRNYWAEGAIILIAIGILVGVYLIQPYFEMRAFNKFSDKKASYWDAVVSELRINAQ